MIRDMVGSIYKFHGQTVKLVWSDGEDLPLPMLDDYGDVICDDDKVLKAYRYEPPYGEEEIGVVCDDGEIVDIRYDVNENGSFIVLAQPLGNVNDLILIAEPSID